MSSKPKTLLVWNNPNMQTFKIAKRYHLRGTIKIEEVKAPSYEAFLDILNHWNFIGQGIWKCTELKV